MPPKRQNSNQQPEIIDVEFTTVGHHGAPLAPYTPVASQRRNRPRSNIQDGGYFDASHRRRPIFFINPADDQLAALMALRAWLSAFRHNLIWTPLLTLTAVWSALFAVSAVLNFARGNVKFCVGDVWNPVVSGCNVASLLASPIHGTAGAVHDVMLGEGELAQPIETRTRIRAVRTDGDAP
jgi:hypothetical protein